MAFGDNVVDDLETVLWTHGGQIPADQHDLSEESERRIEIITKALLDAPEDLSAQNLLGALNELQRLAEAHDAQPGRDDNAMSSALDRVTQSIAWDLVYRIHPSVDRLFRLSILPKPSSANGRAANFFRCVGRCFVAGYWPECSVTCRAVLEAALREMLPGDDCTEAQREMRKRTIDLEVFQAAARKGWIASATRIAADFVRERGNAAIHGNPVKFKAEEAHRLVASTLQVLSELDQQVP